MDSAPEWFVSMVESRLTDRSVRLSPEWQAQRIVQRRMTVEGVDAAVTTLIERAIATLRAEDERIASLLEAHVLQGIVVKDLKSQFPYVSSYLYKLLNKGRARLAGILWQWEQEEQARWQGQLALHLPLPTYDRYIGGEQRIAAVRDLLFGDGGVPIVAIEGTGGLGKTALAYEIVRRLREESQPMGLGWVSAQQVVFSLSGEITPTGIPALTEEQLVSELMKQLEIPLGARLGIAEARQALSAQLRRKPHLIVVDNLETSPDLARLIPLLKRLAGKSRFLLTTRESLLHDQSIRTWPLPALQLEETRALLLHYATAGVRAALEAKPQEVEAIFEAVGGNPLALRLVVGQCAHSSLSIILKSLEEATGRADRLYEYLFNAAWEGLEELVRSVLMVMPLVCRTGASLAEITEIHETNEATVSAALEQLRLLNLVDRIGELHRPLYTIHNLTNSFLMAQAGRVPR